MNVLSKPLTKEEIKELRDECNYIEGVVKIELEDAIMTDLEGFLDLISEKLVGSVPLMEVNYEVVGTEGSSVLLKVSGDASSVIDEDEEE